MTAATHVRVWNGNDFPIEDRFDGILYKFAPGEADGRLVPILAAANMFGFPVTDDQNGISVALATDDAGRVTLDTRYIARRWGWNTIINRQGEDLHVAVERTNREAVERVQKLKVMAVSMSLREVPLGSVPEVLAPPRDLDENNKPVTRQKMRAE